MTTLNDMEVLSDGALGMIPHHAGWVVEGLESAMDHCTKIMGLTWSTVRPFALELSVDGAPCDVELRAVYSLEGPPHLELIEETSDTPGLFRQQRMNHLGYFADDLSATSEALSRRGFPRRVHDRGPDGRPSRFVFHQLGDGSWLELIATARRDAWIDWLDPSRIPDATP